MTDFSMNDGFSQVADSIESLPVENDTDIATNEVALGVPSDEKNIDAQNVMDETIDMEAWKPISALPTGECEDTTANHNSSESDVAKQRVTATLQLFSAVKPYVGKGDNNSFSTTPTEITEVNAGDFLRYDHITNKFRDGHRHGDNFEYALAIPGDCDNSHSDNQEDWLTHETVHAQLVELGINHWLYSSRNDGLSKDGKSPRPKFHVAFQSSKPLSDKKKYAAICKWFIAKFHGDPAIKDTARQMFGFGNHPNPIIMHYEGGRCIDEVLTDDDLAPFVEPSIPTRKQKTPVTSAARSPRPSSFFQTGNRPGDDFNERGRDDIKRILEQHGWHYIREDNTNEFWLRPGKDPLTRHHSATLKHDEPLFYVFSTSCSPLNGNEAYNFFDVYTLLEHGGNHTAAAKALAQQGYGALSHTIGTTGNAPIIAIPSKRQPFPMDTLPLNLREHIENVAQALGTDMGITAGCYISVLSGVIGRCFEIELKEYQRENAMLWVCMVAPPGFGKTPALNFACMPLDKLEKEAGKQCKLEFAKFKTDLAMYKNSLRQKSDTPITPVQEPTKPIRRRFLVEDTTTEKLNPLLGDNSHGLCLVRDELSGLFSSMNEYKGGRGADLQRYLNYFSGRSVRADRMGDDLREAETPSLSILGGVQTNFFCRIIRQCPDFTTSGFLARFLFMYPEPRAIRWRKNKTIDPAGLVFYSKLIDDILSYRDSHPADDPGIIKLTPEAQDLIFDYQDSSADMVEAATDDAYRSGLSKAGQICARLALVLHVVKCLEIANPIEPIYQKVEAAAMQNAIILTKWFLNESERVYAMLSGGLSHDENELLAKIQDCNGQASIRDLQNRIKKYHTAGGAGIIERLLRGMVSKRVLTVRLARGATGPAVEYFCIS